MNGHTIEKTQLAVGVGAELVVLVEVLVVLCELVVVLCELVGLEPLDEPDEVDVLCVIVVPVAVVAAFISGFEHVRISMALSKP